jgi:predicted CoA-substrate-specific enzyme activase
MIGYICKYTPTEILASMGADPVLLQPKVRNFNAADTLMHPNMCSYVKSVLEEMQKSDYDGIVLTTCCDSVRRLYDVLKDHYPEKFIYVLDLPRKSNDTAISLYTDQIKNMISEYERFSGVSFSPASLRERLLCAGTECHAKTSAEYKSGPHVGLIGARYSNGVRNLLDDECANVVFDITCSRKDRTFNTDMLSAADDDHIVSAYVNELLAQLPCLRMADVSNRYDFIKEQAAHLDGLIYHTVKFCDSYSYEYSELHTLTDIPILKIETDLTEQCEGQIRTRIEAFLETLRTKNGNDPALDTANRHHPVIENCEGKDKEMTYVLGIDSGSTSTNAVIMNGDKKIIGKGSIRTGAKTSESAEKILAEVISSSSLKRDDISMIVSTGYGRVSIPFADKNVTEISCHGKGARYFDKDVRTILDIGGQDSKAIKLGENGDVTDFVMNDKCAAGTGRFLEAMARTLEMDISDLGPISLKSTEQVTISSMCTVFAESEVISIIAQNKEKADIANGVHEAISGKAISLLKRVDPQPGYMMTGGVAKNVGVIHCLEKRLGAPIFVNDDPEIIGATGAALYALEELGI